MYPQLVPLDLDPDAQAGENQEGQRPATGMNPVHLARFSEERLAGMEIDHELRHGDSTVRRRGQRGQRFLALEISHPGRATVSADEQTFLLCRYQEGLSRADANAVGICRVNFLPFPLSADFSCPVATTPKTRRARAIPILILGMPSVIFAPRSERTPSRFFRAFEAIKKARARTLSSLAGYRWVAGWGGNGYFVKISFPFRVILNRYSSPPWFKIASWTPLRSSSTRTTLRVEPEAVIRGASRLGECLSSIADTRSLDESLLRLSLNYRPKKERVTVLGRSSRILPDRLPASSSRISGSSGNTRTAYGCG